jgi:hypothetical protein
MDLFHKIVVVCSVLLAICFMCCVVMDWPSNFLKPKVTLVSAQDAQEIVDTMRYVKDKRTGLCYAVAFRRLTRVPCDRVEDYLGK